MRILLSLIWLVLAGIWLALGYLLAGLLLCTTIIGIALGDVVRLESLSSADSGVVVVSAARYA